MKRILLALLAAAALACGDVHTPGEDIVAPSTTSPAPGAQAKIIVNAASRTDQQLDVSAQVLDSNGHGIPNVPVQFTITNGTVTPPIVNTDGSGVAKSVAIATGSVTLTATTGIVSASATVIGGATPLSVVLSIPSVTVGTASTLNANVSGQAIGGPFSYVWTYGDGVSETGASASVTHTYAGAGTYQASVKVSDGAGRSATAGASAQVNAPAAPPTPTPTPAATLSVTITCTPQNHGSATPCNVNASYGSTQLQATAITNVDWDWGDGTPIATNGGVVATHNYVNAGTYVVFAAVTATADGASRGPVSGSKSITVN